MLCKLADHDGWSNWCRGRDDWEKQQPNGMQIMSKNLTFNLNKAEKKKGSQ